jgi:cardiolipin synthase
MIHTKTIVVDGLFSIVGSSNFDSRSAQINEELDITVYDEGFGAEMNEVFQRDLQQSKAYRIEDFKKRGALERFSEWLVAPLAPLL